VLDTGYRNQLLQLMEITIFFPPGG
jgi:hypothetical protein